MGIPGITVIFPVTGSMVMSGADPINDQFAPGDETLGIKTPPK
jgi:hypothetical protein